MLSMEFLCQVALTLSTAASCPQVAVSQDCASLTLRREEAPHADAGPPLMPVAKGAGLGRQAHSRTECGALTKRA
jgi:hypothetical protein